MRVAIIGVGNAGGLPAARVLELMAALHIGLNLRNGWPWRTGWKLLGPPPATAARAPSAPSHSIAP